MKHSFDKIGSHIITFIGNWTRKALTYRHFCVMIYVFHTYEFLMFFLFIRIHAASTHSYSATTDTYDILTFFFFKPIHAYDFLNFMFKRIFAASTHTYSAFTICFDVFFL